VTPRERDRELPTLLARFATLHDRPQCLQALDGRLSLLAANAWQAERVSTVSQSRAGLAEKSVDGPYVASQSIRKRHSDSGVCLPEGAPVYSSAVDEQLKLSSQTNADTETQCSGFFHPSSMNVTITPMKF
jgi:hypothetical protein